MRRRVGLMIATLLLCPVAGAGDFYVSAGLGLSVFDDTASASVPGPAPPGQSPIAASLNGQRFDSNETATALTVGWNAYDWLSVELGYTDFGNTGQSGFPPPPFSVTTAPSFQFIPPGPVAPPGPISGISVVLPADFFASALSVEEWSLSATFRKPLVSDLSANWSVGITRARFDAEGSFNFDRIVSLSPVVTERVDVVYESPGNETGYRYGFGFDWRINDRFSVDLGYRRHDTRVIDIETFMLQFIVAL